MKKLIKGKIYLVLWIDTFQSLGWQEVYEIEESCKRNKEWIKTVSFYVGESHGYYIFCSQFTENPLMKNWSGMTAIPIGVIKK